MSGSVPLLPLIQFSNAAGAPLANGTVTTYVAGSLTLAATYQDEAMATLNDNPIQLDSSGQATVYLDPTTDYKFLLKNAAGATVPGWPVDNISGAVSTVAMAAAMGVDRVSVKDSPFNATGDGSTDDTAAIQAALDYAYTNRKLGVFFPPGIYMASQLTFYSGLSITGAYHGSFGLGNEYGADYVGSVIKQIEQDIGADPYDAFITFETLHQSGTADLIGPFHMQGLSIVGNGQVGSGDGIRFQSADMAALGLDNSACTRTVRLQAITILRDVLVRNFSGNGIWMPNCHVGISLQNVYSGFNGGYGLFFDVSTGLLDGLAVRDFIGDANLLGLIGFYKMGSTFDPSDIKDHTVILDNITAEMRANPQTFAAGATGQTNAIVFDQCDSGSVIIKNLKHYSIVSGDKPGDTIVIKNQTVGYCPTILGESVMNTIKPSHGQDVSIDTLGAILNDTANSVTVPANTGYFAYGFRYSEIAVGGPTSGKAWLLGGGYTKGTMDVGTGGVQATGTTPVLGLYESDAAADLKTWGWVASSGELTLRSYTDAGTADIALALQRAAGVVSVFDFKKNVKFSGSVSRGAPVTKTGDFTVASDENWLICNKGSGMTVSLPTPAFSIGRELYLKNVAAFTVISSSANVVPRAGGAAATAILPATAGAWVTLVCDGTNWIVMAGS